MAAEKGEDMTMHATSAPNLGQAPDSAAILKAATACGVIGTAAGSAPRLLAVLCNPDVPTDDVASLVRGDPALSLRVLRVANSAYYGQARSISKIERAIGLLGLNAVRGIAAAACLDRVLPQTGQAPALDMTALLRHSRATAVAAQLLADTRCPARSTDAFIAGLLHNVGTTVQHHVGPAAARSLMVRCAAAGTQSLRQLEVELAVAGHEECGAVVFAAWNLPDALIAATRHHHDPMAAPEAHRDLAALIHLGAHMALAAGFTFDLAPPGDPADPEAMTLLGLDADQIALQVAALPDRVAKLDEALSGA
jgi:HD-like signal output (HDOD) protein